MSFESDRLQPATQSRHVRFGVRDMTRQLPIASRFTTVLVILFLPRLAGVLFGQDRPARIVLANEPTKATPYVFGVRTCQACHNDPNQKNDLCEMTEYHIWANRDPHRLALDWGQVGEKVYRSKSADRAWAIGQNLGIPDVTTSKQCIGCHSVSAPPQAGREVNYRPKEEGVNCVACHGSYLEWVGQHLSTGDTPWSHKTRAMKWEESGMVDLWNPVTRARLCLSCHVGDPDAKTGKFITHAMYAAGHPPLPSIEVATYSEEQPRHWLNLRSKNANAQRRLEFNVDRLEQTEQVVVSGLVAFARSMELFEAGASTIDDQPRSREFAQFDCTGCHHELRTASEKSWRPDEGRARVGRPSTPRWPMALVRLGLDAADPDQFETRVAELDRKIAKFHAALSQRPFGADAEASAAAHAIVEWLKEPLEQLRMLASVKPGAKGRVINQAESLRLLRRLVETGRKDLKDYESARQISWAFRTIFRELCEVAHLRPSENNAIATLVTNQTRIREILSRLDTELALSLQKQGGLGPSGTPPLDLHATSNPQPIIGSLLDHRLRTSADYDPEVFRDRFKALSEMVPVQ